MSTICFYAQFVASKIGVNSLTVTWDIERITRSDGTRSVLVTGGANGITIGRRGLYGYVLTGADLTLYDYVGTAITSDATVDVKEIPALWTLWAMDDGGNGGSLSLLYIVSSGGLPVQGATVELYPTDAYSGIIDSQITNALGQVTFNNLVAGTYYLKTLRAGYSPALDSEVVV